MPFDIAIRDNSDIIASLLLVVLLIVGLRIWHATVYRVVEKALSRAENLSRERQLRVRTLARVMEAAVATLFVLIAGLTVFNLFIDIAPLLAGAGVIGLAIGLGAQSLIRDYISGFFILLENHFGVGDVIRINDKYAGSVEHLDLRRTVMRNLQGWVVTVPNGEIRVVANMTKDWSRMVVDVAVAYREDVDRVLAVLEAVGDELMVYPEVQEHLLERPEILGVEELGESQVTIRVFLKTVPTKQWMVGRRYRDLVKKAFDRERIEIPFPHHVVITRLDGLRTEEEEAERRVPSRV